MSDDVALHDVNATLQLMLRMVLLLLLLLLQRTIGDAESAVTHAVPSPTGRNDAPQAIDHSLSIGLYAAGRMTGFCQWTDGAPANATGFDIFVCV